ncbi:MAG: metal transporter [Oceanospirillaceae bacterium]|uniref:magnesium transporter CorA family protein n=1 Tax=unclassified Thalassolituus TaxID=2624967 RepID=UPI000C4D6E3C|nr:MULTISPECIES: magnesium transporter CorA family protein [unclassified Thalassolituus]MAS23829.1 metal transporter [Oceanospirillaceae bacterium]MAX99333.1 metal transporter [Oceanospirillaceae bacterium]MBL33781.1 metal transporter [Oceanospirillaceae bacterium]MBS53529.1 metal transporter [Oceanospirillaceae bacterium]
MRTLLIDGDNDVTYGGAELVARWKADSNARIWVDLCEQNDDAERALLEDMGCHALAVTDALRERHPPKIEDFDDHVFILYRGIKSFDDGLNHEGQNISFFIGERFLVTRHPHAAISIDRMMKDGAALQLKKSPAHLALRIMHTSAGIYLDTVLAFEERLVDLEDELMEQGNDELMKEVIGYKSRLVKLRRTFNYHQNITDELKTGEYSLFPEGSAIDHVVIDLHDRFERLHSLINMFYELCGDLVDGYISITSHQLNSTMRVLTVITAIFVPLSFLAGLYGMNFEYIPELKVQYGYFILLAVMFMLAGGLLWAFRRMRWL